MVGRIRDEISLFSEFLSILIKRDFDKLVGRTDFLPAIGALGTGLVALVVSFNLQAVLACFLLGFVAGKLAQWVAESML